MKILVTGGTGNVGNAVSKRCSSGGEVRLLSRKQPEVSKLPAGVEAAIGELTRIPYFVAITNKERGRRCLTKAANSTK